MSLPSFFPPVLCFLPRCFLLCTLLFLCPSSSCLSFLLPASSSIGFLGLFIETTQLYANLLWRTPSEGATLSLWHLPLVHSSKALFRWALTLPAGSLEVAPPLTHLSTAQGVTGPTIFYTIPGLREVGFLWNTPCYSPFSLCSCWPIPKQFLTSH